MQSENKYLNRLSRQRMRGSSIMEVLIALAIISFCLTLMVVIFLNMQKSSVPFLKLKANEIAATALRETLQSRTFSDDEFKREEFSVKKTVSVHSQLNDCMVIRILVFDTEKKRIAETSQVVYYGR